MSVLVVVGGCNCSLWVYMLLVVADVCCLLKALLFVAWCCVVCGYCCVLLPLVSFIVS